MTTLVAVYNLQRCISRCDASCYDAIYQNVECDCICRGKNHGVGLWRATENVTKELVGLTRPELEAFAVGRGDYKAMVVINRLKFPNSRHAREVARNMILQLDLFGWVP